MIPAQQIRHFKNPWFYEEYNEEIEDNILVFKGRQSFENFKSYLKQELDEIPLQDYEKEYYKQNIIDFVQEQVPILRLAPKQATYLRAIQDMKNKRFILLTHRGGSKTMLSALTSVWVCDLFDRYFQTALGGAFSQTKALSGQATTFLYDNPRLGLSLSAPPSREEIKWINGSLLLSLKASETSARSPHPSGLMLDEFVVMREEIIKAARGQLAETGLGFHRHGRLIVTSTAQAGPSVSAFKDLFMGGWRVFEFDRPPKYWNHFLSFNWSLMDCTWKTKEEIDDILLTKLSTSEEEWAVEYEGKFGTATGSILREDDIDFIVNNAIDPAYEHKSPVYPTFMGVDWGYSINPTVVIVVQKQSDGIVRTLEMESGLKVDYDYWLGLIEDWCKKYKIVAINADASSVGENLRLRKRGLPIAPIHFGGTTTYSVAGRVGSGTYKDIMLDNLQYMVQKHLVEVHSDFQPLVKEMKNYQWEEQKKSPKRKPIKKGVDHIEAFQLALMNLREGAYVPTAMSSVIGSRIHTASHGIRRINSVNYSPGVVNEKSVTASVVGGKKYRRSH